LYFDDPATKEEEEIARAEQERRERETFEASNPAFCTERKEEEEKRNQRQADTQSRSKKLREKGNTLFNSTRKCYDEAITLYGQALELEPYEVKVLTNIAICHSKLHEWNEAIEYASRAHFLDGTNPKPLFLRSKAQMAQNNIDEALADIDTVLKVLPNDMEMKNYRHLLVYLSSLNRNEAEVRHILIQRDNEQSQQPVGSGGDSEHCVALESTFVVPRYQSMQYDAMNWVDSAIARMPEFGVRCELDQVQDTKWAQGLIVQKSYNVLTRTYIRTSGLLASICKMIVYSCCQCKQYGTDRAASNLCILMSLLAEFTRYDSRSKTVVRSVS
jgi:tetratricopeptide (TPR) repeat protein